MRMKASAASIKITLNTTQFDGLNGCIITAVAALSSSPQKHLANNTIFSIPFLFFTILLFSIVHNSKAAQYSSQRRCCCLQLKLSNIETS